ncbi:MAG: hypothetical protein J1F20_01610 [Muribaculaceae bacterium]|nr:hypothetical protein [Muribaculaceae bacterium]
MTVSDFFSKLGATIKSVVKICLQSRPGHIKGVPGGRSLIIMANGPSLNDTIEQSLDTLQTNDTLSVNFAPNSEKFSQLRPKYHVLADPLFFSKDAPRNVVQLYESLSAVNWPLTLLVPKKNKNDLPREVIENKNISVEVFNFVGAEGFDWFENLVYGHECAMPRPRNVLIPAIMCGIWLGYKDLYVTGADHSWMRTISVDSDNNVISVQPHFYKDDKSEQKRVDTTYRNYKLHDIVYSFYVAFRSYHRVARFACNRGVKIFNSTPGSYIDAFPRKGLPLALRVKPSLK